MSINLARAWKRVAVVCAFVASSVGTVFVSHAAAGASAAPRERHALATESATLDRAPRGHHPSTPVRLPAEGGSVLAFAPTAATTTPVTVVYLHGRNGRAENGCPWMRAGAADLGWLVCPEGARSEGNGTASWGGDVFEQGAVVGRAIRAAEALGAAAAPGVAVGFSQGSYVALDLVKTHQGRFRGLVLLAAPEAHPSAQKLREAGVERIALGAGARDSAYAVLVADAKRLASEGIEARFFDLGNVGHTYATENPEVLREAIAWAGGANGSR